ncbi:3-hydroxyisobutyrate dehydrogenase [Sporosarcina luteola]|uniref:3-hydroxyisobutyrate dehydrogenase n=1 Tax=Sporosarcina luteola TaxID=582850 RepID=A0A511Z349_9BACL|nr:NAD(P)-dependent oxidoreductase [Sporosarcina luteola]GEN81869.1 3-hydroxyisobutyrate dehydrogenase [Sporosarcina luteola]
MERKVGVIGLGNMGSAIAEKLAAHFQVVGFDIDEAKREAMREFGVMTESSIEAVVSQTEVVLLSMPKASISKGIVQQISPLMAKGAIIIETSTILPSEVLEMQVISMTHGVRLIDAAILGGVGHMRSQTATLLVGDSDNSAASVMHVLEAISTEVQIMGRIGAGMSAKIINNGVAHAVMSVIVESSALAVKLGIEPQKVYELLRGETALLRPLTHRYHERIQNGEYAGGMSTINARKDSTLFLQLAQEKGIPLFSVQAAHSVYEMAMQEGFGNEDYAAIAKLWERWSGIDFTE